MVTYSTDKYALGYNLAAPGGVYPQIQPFSTAVSPGGSIAVSQTFVSSDLIGLFWIDTPGRLYEYRVEIPVLDNSTSSVMTMNLVDGSGNIFASGLTQGQSRASGGTITDQTALPGLIGQFDYNTASIAWVGLQVQVAAAGKVSTTSQNVKGWFGSKRN